MYALARLIDTVIQLYVWVLIVAAVLSWLVVFGIVNRYNAVGRFCNALTEPALRPIRKVVPLIGGIDLSPLILILLLWFLRGLLFEYVFFP